MATRAQSPVSAVAVIEPAINAAPAARQVRHINDAQSQTVSSIERTVKRPVSLPIQRASTTESAASTTKSGASIIQTSARIDSDQTAPPSAKPTTHAVKVETFRSEHLLRPSLSFGFNDLERETDRPVNIEIPPSMKRSETAKEWELGSSELTGVQIEDLQ